MKILKSTPINQPAQPAPKNPEVVDTTVAAPDLEKEVLEEPLDEAHGLNDDVEEVASVAQKVLEKGVATRYQDIIRSMESGKATPFHFDDPRLHDTGLGTVVVTLLFLNDSSTNVMCFQRAVINREGDYTIIRIEIGYGSVFLQSSPDFQRRSINRLAQDQEMKSTLVHELTHSLEDQKRVANGADASHLDRTNMIAKLMLEPETPELQGIAKRLYVIAAPEQNAWVSEVASLMKNAAPGSSMEELITTIKKTEIWKGIKMLHNFDPDMVYKRMTEIMAREHAQELPQGDKAAFDAKIAEGIRDTLADAEWLSGDKGHSKISNQVRRLLATRLGGANGIGAARDVKYILQGLQKLFASQGDILKRKVYKTISLAKDPVNTPAEKPTEAPLQEDGDVMVEDYPASFDMGEFWDLRNYTQRINYCKQHLGEPLGAGSSRIVYAIDDQKVLKLAKNAKGIAQNENESAHMFQQDYGDYVTKVFNAHPQDLWVEMEKAVKITPTKFKQITGVRLEDLHQYLCNRNMTGYKNPMDPRIEALLADNEFVTGLDQMVGDYALHPGDMGRTSTWGLVHRDGQEMIVMVDFGLTQDNYETHYSGKSASANRYRHAAYTE